jgi:spore maturation protein CgeB
MIQRIDLFMPPDNKSRYGVLPHFTQKLAEALSREGVHCRVLKAEKSNPKPFLEALYKDPPDCTLSFNGLMPDDQGRFFCDAIKIPHVACLIDSPTEYLILASSPYTIITCPDRFCCEFFKGLRCENVLFMPHAVEKELAPPKRNKKRKYEVTMLSSCIDYESLADLWPSKYPKAVREAMQEAIDLTLSNTEISCIQAFIQTMDRQMGDSRIVPGVYNYPEIIDQIEIYTKGKERVKLMQVIQDAPIHLFGAHEDLWKKYLGSQSNIIFHEAVDFETAIEVMKNSQMILNSCAWLKDGTHERILAGLACGALVITNENIYMREHFRDDYNIAFYQMGKWDQVNQKVNDYLAHPEKMALIAERGREEVMHKHTWDHRAKTLLKELPAVLKRLKEKAEEAN